MTRDCPQSLDGCHAYRTIGGACYKCGDPWTEGQPQATAPPEGLLPAFDENGEGIIYPIGPEIFASPAPEATPTSDRYEQFAEAIGYAERAEGQGGVRVIAVDDLVKRWREMEQALAEAPPTSEGLRLLAAGWRAQAMSLPGDAQRGERLSLRCCADQLDAALATPVASPADVGVKP